MTDFNEWYTMITPEKIFAGKTLLRKLQQAYEAGAASQAKTLRDEFAMAALANYRTQLTEEWACADDIADQAYGLADAMLSVRKENK
jgi:hypothetical protein